MCSCSYVVDLNDIDRTEHLHLRCFPGERDTTFIELKVATPSNMAPYYVSADAASVSLWCGEEQKVQKAQWKGDGMFYSVFSGAEGELVKITASLDGAGRIEAESVFPKAPAISVTVCEGQPGILFKVEIPDDTSEENKYALRISRRELYIYDLVRPDIQKSYRKIIDNDEVQSWTFPGEGEGALYDDMNLGRMRCTVNGDELFIFTDKGYDDGVIRLEIPMWYHDDYVSIYYDSGYDRTLAVYKYYYKLDLYSLSDDMFDYFEAKKKIDNNDLSGIGFAPMNFRSGNVRGGYGVLGCCSLASSGWLPNLNPMPEYDNYDDGVRLLKDWLEDF